MIRRLPVYLLIDCSESMIGQGIEAVRAGLSSMIGSLRRNPHALESVFLSVITYDAKAQLECPLTPLIDFQEPKLNLWPGTSLGAALTLLADRIQSEVRKTSYESKGDYRPLVLLLTDGQPSDDWRTPLKRIGVAVRPRPANIYAIGCGEDVDFSVLQSVTDVVLRMDEMSPESFGKLFVWLTASVSSASQGTGETASGEINLQKLPDNIVKVETPTKSLEGGPPRQVFLRVRCSVKRHHYLMRYRFDSLAGCYQPTRSHQLSEAEALATGEGQLPDIPSELLNGAPDCPWCGNPDGGQCGNCGTMFCADSSDPSDFQCPGCNTILKRNPMGERSNFNVRQSNG
ncbi:MAG: VWA domain-containing protein [Verrucomicrobia bacterium]|nr:MAG: VWA domain-containing protein [Verrucomicrobiota bacterium]